MLLTVLLCACAGVVAWLRWRVRHRKMLDMAEMFPGPPTLPGFGNAWMFICEPEEMVRTIRKMVVDYGDVIRFWLGPDLNVVVSDPDELKGLLSNPKNSVKGPLYKFMVPVVGEGILSGSGPVWRKHRKIATPNYGKRAIEAYSDVFNREATLLVDKLRSQTGKEFDIYKYVVQTTSYSVCQTLMGLSKQQTMAIPFLQDIIEETTGVYDVIFNRMTKWYLQIEPIFWTTSSYSTIKTFGVKTQAMSKYIIKNRVDILNNLEQGKLKLVDSEEDSILNTQLSVIDRFIISNELDVDELINETFTIFTSSQEASAKMCSFLLLMMAYHPECQQKLYAEIQSIFGNEDRSVTDEDIRQMPYLDMALKEILRLFPIGAILQRLITEDTKIGDKTIPAGTSLVAPIYHMHRDPRFWDNPDAFDPERFSPENTAKRQPNCYLPFSIGPMDCLGRYFGTKLIKTICIRVLQNFEVTSLQTYSDLRVIIAVSVISVNGYPVILKPRNLKNHAVQNGFKKTHNVS